MRTSVSQNTTWEPWETASTPGEVQVRLGGRYQGQLGFRRLLLAETLIALMQQQMREGMQEPRPRGRFALPGCGIEFIRIVRDDGRHAPGE